MQVLCEPWDMLLHDFLFKLSLALLPDIWGQLKDETKQSKVIKINSRRDLSPDKKDFGQQPPKLTPHNGPGSLHDKNQQPAQATTYLPFWV